jgi:hypothetical protein
MTAVFQDRRVPRLHTMSLKDAQLVVCQEALRRGALTSSELAARAGPTRAVRVSIRSPLWVTPLATIYFPAEHAAGEWARDLLARLPHVEHPKPGARADTWRVQISSAKITRSGVAGGPVLAVLEPTLPAPGAAVCAEPPGCRADDDRRSRIVDAQPLEQLAQTIASALAPIGSCWVVANVARVSRPSSGNVFLTLAADQTEVDAVVFAGARAKVGPVPKQGQLIAAHVARVSLYQARGRLSLVIDRLEPPGPGLDE